MEQIEGTGLNPLITVNVHIGSPEAEAQIISGTPVSARPFEQRLIPLRDVTGQKILDIGGGLSDATAHLISQGADATALDPAYDDPDGLRKKSDQYLSLLQTHQPEMFESRAATVKAFWDSFEANRGRYIGGTATSL